MAERRSWIAASSWKQPSAQFFLEIGSNFLGFRSSLWELFAKRVWTTILLTSLSQNQKQMLPSASPSPPAGPTPTTITNGFTFRNKSDRLLYLLYIYCISHSDMDCVTEWLLRFGEVNLSWPSPTLSHTRLMRQVSVWLRKAFLSSILRTTF